MSEVNTKKGSGVSCMLFLMTPEKGNGQKKRGNGQKRKKSTPYLALCSSLLVFSSFNEI
jgi:hypothetical protein